MKAFKKVRVKHENVVEALYRKGQWNSWYNSPHKLWMKYGDILMIKLLVLAKQEFLFCELCEICSIHHCTNKRMAFILRKLLSKVAFIR